MKLEKADMARFAFWSICVVIATWATLTVVFECRLGWPATREQWGHRLIGWFIQFVLVRTFYRGVKRYYQPVG